VPAVSSSRPSPTPAPLEPRFHTTLDDFVTAISIAPDGRGVAAATASGAVVAVSADGKTSRELARHEGGALAVAWGPRALASGGQDARVVLRDLATDVPRSISTEASWVEHLAWSPSGEELAIAAGRVVDVVDPRGAARSRLREHGSTVAAVAWSPRDSVLACASYGGLRLFDPSTGALVRHLPWKGSLLSLAWSPDAKVIACASQDCSVHFWRLPGGQDSEMQGFPMKPTAIAWDGASRLLATGGDKVICVWRFEPPGPEGRAPHQLEGHDAMVTSLAFHPRRGLLASGAHDGVVMLWDVVSERAIATVRLEDQIVRVAWWPDGSGVVASTSAGELAFIDAPVVSVSTARRRGSA